MKFKYLIEVCDFILEQVPIMCPSSTVSFANHISSLGDSCLISDAELRHNDSFLVKNFVETIWAEDKYWTRHYGWGNNKLLWRQQEDIKMRIKSKKKIGGLGVFFQEEMLKKVNDSLQGLDLLSKNQVLMKLQEVFDSLELESDNPNCAQVWDYVKEKLPDFNEEVINRFVHHLVFLIDRYVVKENLSFRDLLDTLWMEDKYWTRHYGW